MDGRCRNPALECPPAMLGQMRMNVATRLMGLILAALAVEFITSGLGEKFPGLLR